ncbi:BQ2448_140 [Microbotryum intermedium]|uniref:Ribokinase n=1 Tax=Microbotryum intermedium TaxID=269621 RepID=A0A238F5K2_9BASI|nr:BQ2448_140 [Microbotryum intermedium]
MMHPWSLPDDTVPIIMVVGSINDDEFFEVPHIVNTGETIASTRYTRRLGGKGANQAVAAARAGGSVSFYGHIHCDDTARIRQALKLDRIDVSHLTGQRNFATGRALIQLSTTTKDNSIILFPGANHASSTFSPYFPGSLVPNAAQQRRQERIRVHGPRPTPHGSTKYCLLQNEIPLSRTIGAAQWAETESRTTKVMFNPSPMLTTLQIKENEEALMEHVHWWIFNEGEAKALLEALQDGEDEAVGVAVESGDVLGGLGRCFQRKKGATTGVVMTLGAEGVESLVLVEGVWERLKVGPGKVGAGGVRDTTGAGDCFTGYFATELSRTPDDQELTKEAVEEGLRIASQAAALCVGREGALDSFPRKLEVKRIMDCGGV